MANPYQAPSAPSAPSAPPAAPDARATLGPVARGQRWVNLMVLVSFVVLVAISGLGIGSPVREIAFGLVNLASMVMVARLAHALYQNVGVTILVAIGGLIPYVSLIVMIAVNQVATKRLRNAGFAVGLLGADVRQFD